MKYQKGFSLIELLVVVAILGILGTAGSFAYTKYIDSAKDAVNAANLKQIHDALQAEDAQLSFCKNQQDNISNGQDSLFSCLNTIIANSNLKNPYGENLNLIEGQDSSIANSVYDLTYVDQTYPNSLTKTPWTTGSTAPPGIYLLVCFNYMDAEGTNFSADPDAIANTQNLAKRIGLVAIFLNGKSRVVTVNLNSLTIGKFPYNTGACGGG